MLQIECPFCQGKRDEEEFTYGGPFERKRPETPTLLSDEDWSTYMFTRVNTKGYTLERWRHTYGCRQWFAIERHTESHHVKRTFMLEKSSAELSDIKLIQEQGDNIHEIV